MECQRATSKFKHPQVIIGQQTWKADGLGPVSTTLHFPRLLLRNKTLSPARHRVDFSLLKLIMSSIVPASRWDEEGGFRSVQTSLLFLSLSWQNACPALPAIIAILGWKSDDSGCQGLSRGSSSRAPKPREHFTVNSYFVVGLVLAITLPFLL